LKEITTAPPPAPAAVPAAAEVAVAVAVAAPLVAAAVPVATAAPLGGAAAGSVGGGSAAVNAGVVHVSEHDWHGTHPSHISFSEGDFIRVLKKDLGGGWWKGSCVVSPGHPSSETGLFPGAYCRTITAEESEALQLIQGENNAAAAPPRPEALAVVAALPVARARPVSIVAPPKRNGAAVVHASPAPAPAPVAKARPMSVVATTIPSVARVVASFEYEPEKSDELSFVEGDFIDVTQMNDDGWYAGFVLKADGSRGDFGFFPENYVEQVGGGGISEA